MRFPYTAMGLLGWPFIVCKLNLRPNSWPVQAIAMDAPNKWHFFHARLASASSQLEPVRVSRSVSVLQGTRKKLLLYQPCEKKKNSSNKAELLREAARVERTLSGTFRQG